MPVLSEATIKLFKPLAKRAAAEGQVSMCGYPSWTFSHEFHCRVAFSLARIHLHLTLQTL